MFEDLREQMMFQAFGKDYLHTHNYYVERAIVPGIRTEFESEVLLSNSINYFPTLVSSSIKQR